MVKGASRRQLFPMVDLENCREPDHLWGAVVPQSTNNGRKNVMMAKKVQFLLWAFSLVFVFALSNASSAQDLKCENDEQKKDRVGTIDSLVVNRGKARVEVVLTKPISRWDLLRAPNNTWVFVDIMEAA